MYYKIREILYVYTNSIKMNKNCNTSTCAVCFEIKGKHSKTLQKITNGISDKNIYYIWPTYSMDKKHCLSVICSNCRRNLFSLDKGVTEYLTKWMDQVSKVKYNYIVIKKYAYIY